MRAYGSARHAAPTAGYGCPRLVAEVAGLYRRLKDTLVERTSVWGCGMWSLALVGPRLSEDEPARRVDRCGPTLAAQK